MKIRKRPSGRMRERMNMRVKRRKVRKMEKWRVSEKKEEKETAEREDEDDEDEPEEGKEGERSEHTRQLEANFETPAAWGCIWSGLFLSLFWGQNLRRSRISRPNYGGNVLAGWASRECWGLYESEKEGEEQRKGKTEEERERSSKAFPHTNNTGVLTGRPGKCSAGSGFTFKTATGEWQTRDRWNKR